jgi:hypothetical protein
MKRVFIWATVFIMLFALAGPLSAGTIDLTEVWFFDDPVEEPEEGESADAAFEHLSGFLVSGHYLRRESAVEREDYARARLGWASGNQYLNLRGGVEVRTEDTQVRSYWIGNDIKMDQWSTAHIRLNHLEYGDWETGINHFNVYFSLERWWIRAAVGFGYAALQFDEKYYRDPTNFNTENPESRFIYEVSVRPTFWDRITLDAGFKNYDDFEYHGFDDNGYHIEPIIHITEDTDLSFFYERRYAAAFISVPTLTRTTWMVSFEKRF